MIENGNDNCLVVWMKLNPTPSLIMLDEVIRKLMKSGFDVQAGKKENGQIFLAALGHGDVSLFEIKACPGVSSLEYGPFAPLLCLGAKEHWQFMVIEEAERSKSGSKMAVA